MSIGELGGAPNAGLQMGMAQEQRMMQQQQGHQLMTGQRGWGTFEPQQKRQRHNNPMQMIQHQLGGAPPPPPMQYQYMQHHQQQQVSKER